MTVQKSVSSRREASVTSSDQKWILYTKQGNNGYEKNNMLFDDKERPQKLLGNFRSGSVRRLRRSVIVLFPDSLSGSSLL